MEYRDVDWNQLPPGTELDNIAERAPSHSTTYAEWSYVSLNGPIAKFTLLAFMNSPVNQRLAVEQRNGEPFLAGLGFKAKPNLVEQGNLIMERSGALAMAGVLIAMAHSENSEEVQAVLAAHGLEITSRVG